MVPASSTRRITSHSILDAESNSWMRCMMKWAATCLSEQFSVTALYALWKAVSLFPSLSSPLLMTKIPPHTSPIESGEPFRRVHYSYLNVTTASAPSANSVMSHMTIIAAHWNTYHHPAFK